MKAATKRVVNSCSRPITPGDLAPVCQPVREGNNQLEWRGGEGSKEKRSGERKKGEEEEEKDEPTISLWRSASLLGP
jgi:hypothetical protein